MGQFPYVELVEATAVAVQPQGKESRWNVDGELLADNHLSAEVHIFRLDCCVFCDPCVLQGASDRHLPFNSVIYQLNAALL